MTIIEAIQKRHSVRRYTDQIIEDNVLAALQAEVKVSNGIQKGKQYFVKDYEQKQHELV